MKRLEDVKIEDFSAFFRNVSNVWDGKTTTETKRKAIEDNAGKLALVKMNNYSSGIYLFGRIENPFGGYFSMNRPLVRMRYKCEDVQELIVENR